MPLAYNPIYSYKDYLNWEGDWELIDGHPISMAPSPIGPHQGVISKIVSDIENSL